MKTDIQQQLAASNLCDAESWKAFNQMYNAQNAYGAAGFDKNYQAHFPFLAQHFAPYTNPMVQSSFSPSSSSTSSTSSQQHHSSKKKPVPVPTDQKDESYYERRRRNNEAARKSREARRKQDTDNGVRVHQLEQENHYLKAYLQTLVQENTMMKQRLAQQYTAFAAGEQPIPNY